MHALMHKNSRLVCACTAAQRSFGPISVISLQCIRVIPSELSLFVLGSGYSRSAGLVYSKHLGPWTCNLVTINTADLEIVSVGRGRVILIAHPTVTAGCP